MNNYVLREGIIVISNKEGKFAIDLFNRKRLVLNDTAYSIVTAIKENKEIAYEYQDFCDMLVKKDFLTSLEENKEIDIICEEAGL